MIIDIFNKEIVKILCLFSISPGSKHTRDELKNRFRMQNITLDSSLKILIKNKILIKEKRFYSINFENKIVKDLLHIVNKEYIKFKEIPLIIFSCLLDLSNRFSQNNNIKQIFLFGSYAKLIYNDKSDIDLAIIIKKDEKKIKDEIRHIIKKYETKYNKVIESHFFSEKDLKQNDPLIKEILRNGVVFY
jgi:predicted nucleotidyltransferase